MTRSRAAAITALALSMAVCVACGARATPSPQAYVLPCLRASGWRQTASYAHEQVVELRAVDRHAELELAFWPSAAEARRAVPGLAPPAVGWTGRISWRASLGFTLADEQTVDRCLVLPHRRSQR